jgi:hypothetical protein
MSAAYMTGPVPTKKSVLVATLMLRATVGSLLGHDLDAALAPLALRTLARSPAALQLEILAVRHQVDMGRQRQAPSQTWRTFLWNHVGQIVVADLFVSRP